MKRTCRSPMAVTLGLALCLLAACSRIGSQQAAVGQPVPGFTLTSLDGTPFNMADQKGKVVLINVFATW